MYKIILSALILMSVSTQSVFSQTAKEKMKAKMAAAKKKAQELSGGEKTEPVANDTLGFRSLDKVAELWQDGNYAIRLLDQKAVIGFKESISFIKDESGKITTIKIADKEYKAKSVDGSDFVYKYKANRDLYLTASSLVVYEQLTSTNVRFYEIYGNKISKYKMTAEIEEFRKFNSKIIKQDKSDTKDREAKERKEREAANLAKYGLADKEVSKIEIINFTGGKSGNFGCYSGVSYSFKATLKDGTIIRTDKGGYSSDYKVVEKYAKTSGWKGTIDSKFFDKDVYGLEVSLKSNPSVKTYKALELNYKQAISFNWSAYGSGSSNGNSARTIQIKMKQVKHSETGAPLLKVRITEVDGTLLSEFKISPDANILITMQGGYGKNGYNGGNGGNINVIKDPSVKYYSMITDLGGGNGFNNGREGSVKETTRAVNF